MVSYSTSSFFPANSGDTSASFLNVSLTRTFTGRHSAPRASSPHGTMHNTLVSSRRYARSSPARFSLGTSLRLGYSGNVAELRMLTATSCTKSAARTASPPGSRSCPTNGKGRYLSVAASSVLSAFLTSDLVACNGQCPTGSTSLTQKST